MIGRQHFERESLEYLNRIKWYEKSRFLHFFGQTFWKKKSQKNKQKQKQKQQQQHENNKRYGHHHELIVLDTPSKLIAMTYTLIIKIILSSCSSYDYFDPKAPSWKRRPENGSE